MRLNKLYLSLRFEPFVTFGQAALNYEFSLKLNAYFHKSYEIDFPPTQMVYFHCKVPVCDLQVTWSLRTVKANSEHNVWYLAVGY